MPDLLPCPDCGNPPTFTVEPIHVAIECTNCVDYCSLSGPSWYSISVSRMHPRLDIAELKSELVELWNDAVHENTDPETPEPAEAGSSEATRRQPRGDVRLDQNETVANPEYTPESS